MNAIKSYIAFFFLREIIGGNEVKKGVCLNVSKNVPVARQQVMQKKRGENECSDIFE